MAAWKWLLALVAGAGVVIIGGMAYRLWEAIGSGPGSGAMGLG